MKSQRKIERKPRKIVKLILKVLGIALAIFVAYVIIKMVIAAISHDVPTIFGRSYFIVQTGSMEKEIMVGDLVVVKHVDISTVGKQDIVVFTCIDPSQPIYGEVIVHRVKDIVSDGDILKLITQGDANPLEDAYRVTSDNFIGKVVAISSFWGYVLGLFVSPYSIVFVVVLVILLNIVATQVRKIAKIRKESKDNECSEEEEKIKEEILRSINKEK